MTEILICSKAWQPVVSESVLLERQRMGLMLEEVEVGLFVVDGRYYAIENLCPHAAAYSRLSDGYIKGRKVECPFHNAQFDVVSGRCVKQPGRNLKTYDVKVENGHIYIKL